VDGDGAKRKMHSSWARQATQKLQHVCKKTPLYVVGIRANSTTSVSSSGFRKSPSMGTIPFGHRGKEDGSVSTAAAPLAPRVPRKFNPNPFPYHHEISVRVDSLNRLGLGVCYAQITTPNGDSEDWELTVANVIPGEVILVPGAVVLISGLDYISQHLGCLRQPRTMSNSSIACHVSWYESACFETWNHTATATL
jgi:hypothetical protein